MHHTDLHHHLLQYVSPRVSHVFIFMLNYIKEQLLTLESTTASDELELLHLLSAKKESQ